MEIINRDLFILCLLFVLNLFRKFTIIYFCQVFLADRRRLRRGICLEYLIFIGLYIFNDYNYVYFRNYLINFTGDIFFFMIYLKLHSKNLF